MVGYPVMSTRDIPPDAFLLHPGNRQRYSPEWRQRSPHSGLLRVLVFCLGIMLFVTVFIFVLTDRYYTPDGQDNTAVIVPTLLIAATGITVVASAGLALAGQRAAVLKGERLVRGKIADFRSSSVGGEYTIKLVYTFVSPRSAREIRRVLVDTRNDLRGTPPPAPGTAIIIAYRSDEDFKVL